MKKDCIPAKIREAMEMQAKFNETAVLDTSRPVVFKLYARVFMQ